MVLARLDLPLPTIDAFERFAKNYPRKLLRTFMRTRPWLQIVNPNIHNYTPLRPFPRASSLLENITDIYILSYSTVYLTMPKSKRAKVVHLSKVQKKGKALSRKHFDDLQSAAQKYQYVFVFEVDNMRNNHFKEVRKEFSDSR